MHKKIENLQSKIKFRIKFLKVIILTFLKGSMDYRWSYFPLFFACLMPLPKYTYKLKMMIYKKFYSCRFNYDLGRDEVVADLRLMEIVIKKSIDFYEDLTFQFLEIVYPYLTGYPFMEESYEKGGAVLKKR